LNKKFLAAALLTIVPVTAANAMDVATFLTKADGLEKKGVLALMSSDYKLLTGEVQTASNALRAERLAAQKAGRRPAYCPAAKTSLTSRDILTAMRAVAPAQRPRTQVRDALRAYFARRFPCR
jgi:hypothetical protein